MGLHSYSQPSSSEASSVKSRDRRNGKWGIPRSCWCGGDVSLSIDTAGPHMGRAIYRCKRFDDGGLHLTKSWNASIMEEIRDLHINKSDQDDRIDYLTQGPDGKPVHPPMMWARVNLHEKEIHQLQLAVDECVESLSDLRNLIIVLHQPSTSKRGPIFRHDPQVLLGVLLAFISIAFCYCFLSQTSMGR